MKKMVYPVIFTQAENIILIEVPDLEILTEASNITEAIDMARDAVGLKLISLEDDGTEIPYSTDILKIDVNKGTFFNEGISYVSMVKVDNKSVRRNITLPNWLNIEAEKAHINVSKVAQEALMEKLSVSK